MPSVSPITNSPVAKYLTENKVKAHKTLDGYVEFRNAANQLLGRLNKGEAPLGQYRYINIDLYEPESGKLFMAKRTVIEKTFRYFLKEHKFMPIKIELENTLLDFKHNTQNKDTLTKGLRSDLYIDKLKESDELKAERKVLGNGIPDDYPMYEINKPFRYEFKAHLYYPERPIDPSKPIIKD